MTARARRPARRREPGQARSRQMVERIVAAGREVLLQRGYDGTTTNHVAAAAGISPGSLYQYFPNKDAVVDEVIDRYTAGLTARLSHAFLGALGLDTAGAVSRTVTSMLDAFEEDPALLRVLIEQVPRSADSARAVFARRMDELMTAALTSAPGRGPARPVDAMAWILVRAVEHVTISYVLERPPVDRSTVTAELTELIAGYLERRPATSADRTVTRSGGDP